MKSKLTTPSALKINFDVSSSRQDLHLFHRNTSKALLYIASIDKSKCQLEKQGKFLFHPTNTQSVTNDRTPSNRHRFNQHLLVDTTPLPSNIPKVPEIGSSSAPLLSASFFIGARCKPYNDDYMACKTDANGRGELDCMKEGRKVTRCAASVYVSLHILAHVLRLVSFALIHVWTGVECADFSKNRGPQNELLGRVQKALGVSG